MATRLDELTLKLPTVRTAVTVKLVGAEPRALELFLEPAASTHPGPQTVGELLLLPTRFFPATDPVTRGTVLLAREAVVEVSVPIDTRPEATPELFVAEEGLVRREVRFSMRDGSRVEGDLVYALPPERRRLSDFLNSAPAFISLLSPGVERWIALSHIVDAVPLER